MITQSNTTDSALAEDRTAESSRLYQDGIVAGLIGAATIAVWFLILDAIKGRPLYTPTVLGTAIFQRETLPSLDSLPISFEMVLMYTWLHGLIFCVIGGAASKLLALAERKPDYSFGIFLLFVVFEFGFLGAAVLLAEPVLQVLAWPAILVGNLLAAVAMGGYLWHRHPQLRIVI